MSDEPKKSCGTCRFKLLSWAICSERQVSLLDGLECCKYWEPREPELAKIDTPLNETPQQPTDIPFNNEEKVVYPTNPQFLKKTECPLDGKCTPHDVVYYGCRKDFVNCLKYQKKTCFKPKEKGVETMSEPQKLVKIGQENIRFRVIDNGIEDWEKEIISHKLENICNWLNDFARENAELKELILSSKRLYEINLEEIAELKHKLAETQNVLKSVKDYFEYQCGSETTECDLWTETCPNFNDNVSCVVQDIIESIKKASGRTE